MHQMPLNDFILVKTFMSHDNAPHVPLNDFAFRKHLRCGWEGLVLDLQGCTSYAFILRLTRPTRSLITMG